MTSRRDDIRVQTRVQIALAMLSPNRPHGLATELARAWNLSRETVYTIRDKAAEIMSQGLQPGGHGPQRQETTVLVDQDHLRRAVLLLTEQGVSQRGIRRCLSELFDITVSLGWVNGELAALEKRAAELNLSLSPTVTESLSADEIFSNGQPNLLLVGNESLYIYALQRQEKCDGDSWGQLLLDAPDNVQLASDAGKGLLAGSEEAGITYHQLDWDHLLRPLWGQQYRLEKAVYAAWETVAKREALFHKSHTSHRLRQHLQQWERVTGIAETKVAQADKFYALARKVDDCFAIIDLETGLLTDATTQRHCLQTIGQTLTQWSGRIYNKLAKNLLNWSRSLFVYQAPLQQALAPLYQQYGTPAIAALCRLWQCEADTKRHALSYPEKLRRQQVWAQSLDEAWAYLGESQLWLVWDTLSDILSRSWRGSMLAECTNSLIRPVLERRKHTDQGCLELFRFLHNTRPFTRGKRAGRSPAELAGITLSDTPFVLLGLAPEVSR
jgi:hypothetical protein